MTLFYQHIGVPLWARDAPRSLGSYDGQMRRFSVKEIEPYLADLPPFELETLRQKERDLAPTGFQIWGLPAGAEIILRRMDAGDYLLLLEKDEFRYVGQVLHRLSEPSWALSQFIWGEQRFPIIVLLQGQFIEFGWDTFKADFGISPNYNLRGRTARLVDDRMGRSRYGSEEAFVAHLLGEASLDRAQVDREFLLFTQRAEAHLRLVRDRSEQAAFRLAVMERQGAECALCGFAIIEALEAAHLVPKKADGTDDPRNGLILCASHHKLFDSHIFGIKPGTLEIVPRAPWTLHDLRITKASIRHLGTSVHEAAVRWNAEQRRELF